MADVVLDVHDSYMSADLIFSVKKCSDFEQKMINLDNEEVINNGKSSSK